VGRTLGTSDTAWYTLGFEGLCADVKTRKHINQIQCFERTFCHAELFVTPKLAKIDVIANMSDSEGIRGQAQTATASVSTERADINFNCKKHSGFSDARDEYRCPTGGPLKCGRASRSLARMRPFHCFQITITLLAIHGHLFRSVKCAFLKHGIKSGNHLEPS
jgi:hypothetical protein